MTKSNRFGIIVKSCEDAGMAQSVEHVIGNDEVISSILITSSKSSVANATELFRFCYCFFSYFFGVVPVMARKT